MRLYHEQMSALLPESQRSSYPLEVCVVMYAIKQGTMLMQCCTGKYAETVSLGERAVNLIRKVFQRAFDACLDWEGVEVLKRTLEHTTGEGTVDWAKVMQPEIAKEIMGARGRECLALAADGPEMTACRAMLVKANVANDAALAAAAAKKPAAASADVSVDDVSVAEGTPLLSQ